MSYVDELFSLHGKTAIVTGAARGNGEAIAEALLRAGSMVYVCDVMEDELNQTIARFRDDGLLVEGYVCDLSDAGEVKNFISFVTEQSGDAGIDILVNNAGVTCGHSLEGYPQEYWDKTYNVNLMAPFILSKEIGLLMKSTGKGGSIINITSLNAEQAFPDNIAYVTFKGALRQMTKSLALDLGKYGVRANNVGPGYFKTGMTLKSWADESMNEERKNNTILGRWGDPKDLAGVIVFLASDSSSYVTGQDIYVDGGWLTKGM